MAIRLPQDALPSNYRITLTPDLKKFTFEAEEVIELEVLKSTSSLLLHSLELEITKAELHLPSNPPWKAEISFDLPNQTVKFAFAAPIPTGPAELHLQFKGILNDRLAGFYRSSYVIKGEERYMAVTQFEATDARRALVCWDEPAIKATFQVCLRTPLDRLAISNMPIDRTITDVEAGIREHYFPKSPKMSTYLLAFIVGEFDYLSGFTEEGVEVRVYTPLGKTHLGTFALHVAMKALSFYVKLFGIEYPLPKMDLLAIPDFAAGAMENFGCITYREMALLIDEEQSSLDRKQRVARTICHEIAHQWFGNMVTMEWWTHLWLNEGFARFLEFFAIDSLFPDWGIWTQFVSSIHGSALRQDALESSHPIEVPVNHPDEINEIFDTISYAKGASVIRMLCDYLGMDVFFKGLHQYLLKHQWGNATTEDLWAAFEQASGKEIQAMMNTWTSQTGYPVLKFSEESNGSLTLSQSRFLTNGKQGPGVWRIPISCVSDKGIVGVGELNSENIQEFVKTLSSSASGPWLKLNPGQIGFYRVSYTANQIKELTKVISLLPSVDRLGVLSDAFALSKAGFMPSLEVLQMLLHYIDEEEYVVWAEITAVIESLSSIYSGETFAPLFNQFALKILSKITSKLGLASETIAEEIEKASKDPIKMQFKSLIFDTLGHLKHENITRYAKEAFAQHYDHLVKDHKHKPLIHPELRSPVYAIIVASGGEEEFNMVWDIHQKSDLAEEKRRCLQSLGKSSKVELLHKILISCLSKEVRHQDIVFPIGAVSANPIGKDLSWAFLKANWKFFDENFNRGGQNFLMGGLISAVCSVFLTAAMAEEIEAFFKVNRIPSAENVLKQSLETVRINSARLLRDHRELVPQFLESRSWV